MAHFDLVPVDNIPADLGDKQNWVNVDEPDPNNKNQLPGGGDDAFSSDNNMSGSVNVQSFNGGLLVSGSITAHLIHGTGANGSGAHLAGSIFDFGAGASNGAQVTAGDVTAGEAHASGGGSITVAGTVTGDVAVDTGGTVTAGTVLNTPNLPSDAIPFTNSGGTISINDVHTTGGIGINETTALTDGTTTIGTLGLGDDPGTTIQIVLQGNAKLSIGGLAYGLQAGDFTSVEIDGSQAQFSSQLMGIGIAGSGAFALAQGATFTMGSLALGAAQTGNGTISVGSGSGLSTGSLVVGQEGHGSIGVSGGGDITINGDLTVGADASGSGSFSASGVGSINSPSSLKVTGTVTLGANGRGQGATISGGAGAVLSTLVLGSGETGFGSLTVSGTGSEVIAHDTTIGDQGFGSLTVSGGASLNASIGAVVLGKSGGSGRLILDHLGSDGVVAGTRADVGELKIGDAGTGRVDVGTDTTLNVGLPLSVGAKGTLNVNGTVTAQSTVRVGDPANGGGTVNINSGGRVQFDSDLNIGGSSSGSVASVNVFSNGSLKPIEPQAATTATIGTNGNLTVTGSGAEFDVGTLATSGGGLDLEAGGLAVVGGVNLDGGGIRVRGTTSSLVVSDRGTTSGVADGVFVDAGTAIKGSGTIDGFVELDGVLEAEVTSRGSSLQLTGDLDGGSAFIDSGATLSVDGLVGATKISFSGSGAHLTLGTPNGFSGAIGGFGSGDILELKGVSPGSPATIVGSAVALTNSKTNSTLYQDPTVEVHGGDGSAYRFTFTGLYTNPVFTEAANGSDTVVQLGSGVFQSTGFHALDGYLSRATVFRDDNGNRVLDPGEASTTTDGGGSFSLLAGTGPLVVSGGTDVATGVAFSGILVAPSASTVVTPLTTLVEGLLEAGNPDPVGAALAALRLPAGFDLLNTDPIAGTSSGDAASQAAVIAGAQLQDTETLIAAALTASGLDPGTAALKAASGAASFVSSNGSLNLTSATDLTAIATAAGVGSAAANAIGAVAGATNAGLAAAAGSGAVLASVAQVQTTVQGQAAPALAAAGSDPGALAGFVSTFTGGSGSTPPGMTLAALAVLDTTTGQPIDATPQPYSGPVSGLQNQFVYTGSDKVNIAVSSNNWFLHGGPADDALAAQGGTNVLDGGGGSSFLVGSVLGAGTDTFFVDDRSPQSDIFSTAVNFHTGDAATLFGVTPDNATILWVDNEGAAGYTGLTSHALPTVSGAPIASLTLPGYTTADLANGKLSTSFGQEADGTPYLYIHGDG